MSVKSEFVSGYRQQAIAMQTNPLASTVLRPNLRVRISPLRREMSVVGSRFATER